MRRGLLLAIAVLAVLPCAQAQLTAFDPQEIDAYVEAELKRQHIPGASIAVTHRGNPVHVKGYGLANIELGIKTTPDSVFKIASVSKQFVAVGAMLLVQDGKISLEDEASKFFPKAPPEWKGIKVKHLMSHTSGLPRELPGWEYLKDYTEAEQEEMAVKAIPDYKPGERYRYCNTAYFMLGLIISKVSGKPWPEFLKVRIFAPAGMDATRTTTWRDIVPNRASGYTWQANEWKNDGNLLSVRTSGALISSANDMAKWEDAVWNNRIFSAKTHEHMTSPFRLNDGKLFPYGFGWSVDEMRGRKVIGHGGSLMGFRSSQLRFVEDGYSIVVLANSSSADPETIAMGVAKRVIPGFSLDALKPATDPNPDLTSKLRAGYSNVAQGKPFGEIASAEVERMFSSLSETSRKAMLERDKTMTFAFLKEHRPQLPVVRGSEWVERVLHYRGVAGSTVHYTFYFNGAGKLVGLDTTLN